MKGWRVALCGLVFATGCGPHLVPIATIPAGAFVQVDGSIVGRTPLRLDYQAFEARKAVLLYAPGFVPVWLTGDALSPNDTVEITLDRAIDPADRPTKARNVGNAASTIEAWKLAIDAAAAAELGYCDYVIRLDGPIRDLDADVYERVFAREIEIRGCLLDADPSH